MGDGNELKRLYWPRRSFLKNPGTIQLVIGPVIDPSGLTTEEILTKTKSWIESTMVNITPNVEVTNETSR